MQYKIVGDIEEGIHYTRIAEDIEDEEEQKTGESAAKSQDTREVKQDGD